MDLVDLNNGLRQIMLSEFKIDVELGKLYLSKRLSAVGQQKYPELLKRAIEVGDIKSFSAELAQEGILNSTETSHTAKGEVYTKKVPRGAEETLAEGEFNRFYIRAVCVRAVENGVRVIVYRAKETSNPRPESQNKVGSIIEPGALLSDLRNNIGVDTALGLPAGPNSGLSIKVIM